MLQASNILQRRAVNNAPKKLNGGPGPFKIRFFADKRLPRQMRFKDIIVTRRHCRYKPRHGQILHYMGKHVPQPQKSLWSPDCPIPQDRHLFKLTTLDIDAFKYYYGVKRADLDPKVWELLSHSGLLPPPMERTNYMAPRPIFDKEKMYQYYLKHRPPIADIRRRDYLDYANSMVLTGEMRERRKPSEPWL